jgi:hypothetical protein
MFSRAAYSVFQTTPGPVESEQPSGSRLVMTRDKTIVFAFMLTSRVGSALGAALTLHLRNTLWRKM